MPGPDDVVYKASVDDETNAFFQRFDKNISSISDKATAGFEKIAGKLGKVGAVAGVVGGVVGGAVGAVVGQAINQLAQYGDQFLDFLSQSAQLRARADELATTLKVVGTNAGYSADQLKTIEDGMRETGISIIETRQSMARWIQSNLDLAQASKVARVAQDAAVISGTNSSEAYNRITHAIITLQPEILRQLGITVDMRTELDKYAKTLGKTTGQLTTSEKQQAFLNATLESGKTIAGAYEAAMGEVGKQQRSLVRLQEDLQVALGAVFQPAMRVQVEKTTELYKKMAEWLENNQEELEHFGEMFATVFKLALDLLETFVGKLASIPGQIKDAGLAIAQFLGQLSDEEIEKRSSEMGQRFKELAALIIAVFVTAGQVVKQALHNMTEEMSAIWDFLKRKITFDELNARLKENQANADAWGATLKQRFAENVVKAGEFTGAIKKADDATDDLGNTAKQAADDVKTLSEAFTKANDTLAEFYYELQQDIIDQQIKEQRDAIEEALRESWRLEDMARRRAEQINQILQNSNDAQEQALRQSAQNKIDIERNYRRQIRDIQDRFEYDAEELARARDAIGLLRLIRQKKREMAEAKKQRDDAIQDNKINYQRQLAEIDRQRKEQLQRLEDQLAKEEQEYQLSKDREKQIQDLHDQWENEDRQKQYAKRLADLLKNFHGMEGITDDELDLLYGYWDDYFGDLLTLAQQRQAELQAILDKAAQDAQNTFNNMGGSNYGPGTHVYPGQTPTGQDAQVSQLLANPSWITPRPTKASMSSTVQKSTQNRQLEVIVRGEAMDPYIQRQLAMALMEIERNRAM